jgi:cytoskeletal protein CcmA (bactofilin family)
LRRKKAGTNFDSFIGKNTAFKGDIVCSGSVRVDGSVTGDIKAEGDVLLGREGFIKGRIDAVNVHLSGTVEGNVKAAGIFRLLSTARLFGDIEVSSFIADEGAIFQGNCKMIDFEEDKPKERAGRGRKNRKNAVTIQAFDETIQNFDETDKEKDDNQL